MKKLLALLLSIVMLLAALASCNIGAPIEDPPETDADNSDTASTSDTVAAETDTAIENDTDAATDTETDTDAATEMDTEADADTDTETETDAATETETDEVTDTETESETDAPVIPVTLFQSGTETNYVIVYPDNSDSGFIMIIDYLADEINASFPGVNVTAAPALAEWGESYRADCEILIGKTGRPESEAAFAELASDAQYIIRMHESGKLTMAGLGSDVLSAAITEFLLTHVYANSAEGHLTLNTDYVFKELVPTNVRNGWMLSVPSYTGGKLSESVYNTGHGMEMNNSVKGGRMQLITNTTAGEFTAYLSKLESLGYEKVADHTIGDNLYAQYYNGFKLIYTYFTASQNEVRVIQDQASVLETEFEYTYTPRANESSAFYQYALMYDPTGLGGYDPANGKTYENCGLFDVIKFADNSVMLIDGGWDVQATDAAVDEFMKFLREITNTPANGKVRVSAIYLTHGHDDHIAFVNNMVSRYTDSVVVERLMHNMPSSLTTSSFSYFGQKLKVYYPEIKFIKLHTGQDIQIADGRFEVIYTHEDMVNGETGNSEIVEFNNTSLVLKMTLGGKTFMLLGDWGGSHTINNQQETIDEYALLEKQTLDTFKPAGGTNYLKCDIVQVSHHAINDWMGNIYSAIDADYAFFPQQDVAYNTLAHVCYKNIVKQLRNTGMSDSNMHFAGRYTYGFVLDNKGGMTLTRRNIAGADSAYLSQIARYSPFHS